MSRKCCRQPCTNHTCRKKQNAIARDTPCTAKSQVSAKLGNHDGRGSIGRSMRSANSLNGIPKRSAAIEKAFGGPQPALPVKRRPTLRNDTALRVDAHDMQINEQRLSSIKTGASTAAVVTSNASSQQQAIAMRWLDRGAWSGLPLETKKGKDSYSQTGHSPQL